jgi:hypothetical protein
VRAVRAGGGEPAGALLAQEGVQLVGAHRDDPAAPLLSLHGTTIMT